MVERYGIDLGTTYSCISYCDINGEVVIVSNAEGNNTTPSVVQYRDGKFLVGDLAKNSAVRYPGDTVEAIKRHMGKPDYKVRLNGKTFTPEEISAEILRKLVKDANAKTRKNIKEVVITVPAYFGQMEREATEKAARLAGLNLYKIIDEPTASAVSYQYRNPDVRDEYVLIYDLGGGTFDISLVHLLANGAIKVVRHDGKKVLGGKDWDMIILNHILEEYSANNGISMNDLLMDSDLIQTLTTEVENGKKRLSKVDKVEIAVRDDYFELTREKFDELTRVKLENTISIIDGMFDEMKTFGVEIPEISKVLMVGGSTYMPQVKRRLEERFPHCVIESYRPDEAVSRGAAIYAADLAAITINAFKSYGSIFLKREVTEEERCSEDRPTDRLKDKCLEVANIIKIHSELPQKSFCSCFTVFDGQKAIKIEVVENTYPEQVLEMEQYKKYNVRILGSCTLNFDGPKPKEHECIIEFDMENSNGLIVRGYEKDRPDNIVVLPIKLG